MPGVPSYRGCEACYRQKKKAEIPCVGCGQQRYKFKDETARLDKGAAGTQAARHSASASAAGTRSRTRTSAGAGAPSRPLSNLTTLTTGAIVSVLEITDPRYDLFCYGPFIKDIPSQLGRHAALDASADALASAYSCVHTRCVTPDSLRKYVRALSSVQQSLGDPATAYSEQNLCAIYFIMLCQGWLGDTDQTIPRHGEAMAHLLGRMVSRSWTDSLDSGMLVTLSISVLLESLVNPAIRFDPWLFKLAESYKPTAPVQSPDGVVLSSVQLDNLILMAEIVRNPASNVGRMQTLYRLIRLELPRLRSHLLDVMEPACAGPPHTLPVALVRLQTRYQAAYSLLLSMAMVINGFLRTMDAQDPVLAAEMGLFCTETLAHAERLKRRRPLGAGHIHLGLISAWAAVDDPRQLVAMRDMFADYELGFPAFSAWLSKLREGYGRLCSKLPSSYADAGSGEAASDPGSSFASNGAVACEGGDACCIL